MVANPSASRNEPVAEACSAEARIDALEARVAALEARLAPIETWKAGWTWESLAGIKIPAGMVRTISAPDRDAEPVGPAKAPASGEEP